MGLAVCVHKYDGALHTALDKLHRKWQILYDGHETAGGVSGRQYLQWLTNSFECMRCKAHGFHGVVKWSALSYCQDRSCMKSAFLFT